MVLVDNFGDLDVVGGVPALAAGSFRFAVSWTGFPRFEARTDFPLHDGQSFAVFTEIPGE